MHASQLIPRPLQTTLPCARRVLVRIRQNRFQLLLFAVALFVLILIERLHTPTPDIPSDRHEVIDGSILVIYGRVGYDMGCIMGAIRAAQGRNRTHEGRWGGGMGIDCVLVSGVGSMCRE